MSKAKAFACTSSRNSNVCVPDAEQAPRLMEPIGMLDHHREPDVAASIRKFLENYANGFLIESELSQLTQDSRSANLQELVDKLHHDPCGQLWCASGSHDAVAAEGDTLPQPVAF